MARVAVFVLLGRCAGAAKEMVIAYRYGISHVVDAYQITLTLVSWLPGACSAVFAIVLVPAFVELRRQSAKEESQFLGELVAWAMVVGVLFTAILYLVWPYALQFMAGGLSVTTREMARQMLLVMAPIGVLIMIETAYGTRLQSKERHIGTLLDGLPAVMTLLLVLFMTEKSAMVPLMWGTLLGYAVFVLVVWPLGGKVEGHYARLSLTFRSHRWQPIYHAVRVFMLGQLVVSCSPALDQYFVAHLGDGAVATLGYANRVFGLLISMGALAIAQGTLPVLSDILGKDDVTRARQTAFQWSLLMLGAGTLCAVVAYPLAPWMVQVIFQRGAFTAGNTMLVAELMRYALVQLPFYFAALVMMNLLSVEGRYKDMAVVTALAFVVKVIANVVLTRWIGMPGVLLATGMMHAAVFCLSMIIARRVPPACRTGDLIA
ncbi:lipid II flippase MurJ [Caballeronia sp. LZ050]|uniref:murein biosynthesis integral membrane protein MurJ n=2 Tax=unclassified Caballeronia TaxID=2646786 RepID=UPI002855E033|nr:lipid II flippase MurJ [Caballeronia sp. LZ050]MDR5856404.1 lipid II flippase MurJ [Caballeronia sp. LZ050]